jgi:DNA excision repair protein ERCC-4
LESIWHLASSKTKQMVEDLKVLRSLFTYLVNYDSVTFYLYLETIKEANKLARGSGYSNLYSWLLMDAANAVFEFGRARVYERIVDPVTSSTTLIPKFDIQPKWKVLVQIIKEIELERASRDHSASRNSTLY